MLRISSATLDSAALLKAFEQDVGNAGGIVSFSGRVRSEAQAGKVTGLHLQAYSPMTETGIEAAMSEARQRWPLTHSLVAHRIGDMVPGDTIVFVATASKHRRAAFEAADFLMDYLKTEAVFWKKETTPSGDLWIEPRSDDYADAARWSAE